MFLDNLPWPTAITCWNGGVFIGSTPDILYAKDTDGRRRGGCARSRLSPGSPAITRRTPPIKLNVQALLNSFQWGLDNRIHGATSLSGGKVQLVDSEFTRVSGVSGGAADVRRLTPSAGALPEYKSKSEPPHVGC